MNELRLISIGTFHLRYTWALHHMLSLMLNYPYKNPPLLERSHSFSLG